MTIVQLENDKQRFVYRRVFRNILGQPNIDYWVSRIPSTLLAKRYFRRGQQYGVYISFSYFCPFPPPICCKQLFQLVEHFTWERVVCSDFLAMLCFKWPGSFGDWDELVEEDTALLSQDLIHLQVSLQVYHVFHFEISLF